MINVSNTTAQTLAPGQSITFDDVRWHSGCAEAFRNGGSAVRVGNGVYEAEFHGNIGGTVAATAVQLSIELDGAADPTTTMISVPAAIGDLNNVSATTRFGNSPCIGGGISITVTNTGTSTVTIAPNSALSVKRVA